MDQNNPNGETVVTPAPSQGGIITPETEGNVNPQGAPTVSPEEVAFNGLKGDTQTRIKTILSEKETARREAEYWKSQAASQTPQQQTPFVQSQAPVDPDQAEKAVKVLSSVGMATKDEVQRQINQSIGAMAYNYELRDLAERYDGANGLPRFERTEYEDYVQRNPQYQNYSPEDVYAKMYRQEILDAELAKRSGTSGQSQTVTLKPSGGAATQQEPLTPELIEQRMAEPGGKEWYIQNKDKINKALASQAPTQG